MARTITIDPGNELARFIDGLVQTGGYKTTSEVVREGLRLLQEKTAASKLVQLQRLIDEGDNSPELANWSADDFLRRMRKSEYTNH